MNDDDEQTELLGGLRMPLTPVEAHDANPVLSLGLLELDSLEDSEISPAVRGLREALRASLANACAP